MPSALGFVDIDIIIKKWLSLEYSILVHSQNCITAQKRHFRLVLSENVMNCRESRKKFCFTFYYTHSPHIYRNWIFNVASSWETIWSFCEKPLARRLIISQRIFLIFPHLCFIIMGIVSSWQQFGNNIKICSLSPNGFWLCHFHHCNNVILPRISFDSWGNYLTNTVNHMLNCVHFCMCMWKWYFQFMYS